MDKEEYDDLNCKFDTSPSFEIYKVSKKTYAHKLIFISHYLNDAIQKLNHCIENDSKNHFKLCITICDTESESLYQSLHKTGG